MAPTRLTTRALRDLTNVEQIDLRDAIRSTLFPTTAYPAYDDLLTGRIGYVKSPTTPGRYEIMFDHIRIGWVIRDGRQWAGYSAPHDDRHTLTGTLRIIARTRAESAEELALRIAAMGY